MHKIDYESWDEKGLRFVFKKEDKNGRGIENLGVRGKGSVS